MHFNRHIVSKLANFCYDITVLEAPHLAYYGLYFDRTIEKKCFHLIARSKWIEKLEPGSNFSIAYDHDRNVSHDRKTLFPYNRERSKKKFFDQFRSFTIVFDYMETRP